MLKDGTESGMKGSMESGMKNTRHAVLDLIREDNSISISAISERLNITRSTIQKHIDNLRNDGLIRREGADKGGRWVVME